MYKILFVNFSFFAYGYFSFPLILCLFYLCMYYVKEVIQDRYLDRKDLRLLENITLCLDALRMIQIVHNRIDYLKSQSFDLSEHGEHYLLLDILWINLTVITDNVRENFP